MKTSSNDPADFAAQSHASCLTQDQLAELASGHATGDALETACAHLDSCLECQERLEQMGSEDPLLLALAAPNSPDPYDHEGGYHRVTEWLEEEADSPDEAITDSTPPRRIGKYQVIGHLARGGMGDVYAAIHPDLQQQVAIKVVRPRDSRSHVADRFRREMTAVASLDHPNIVRALDAGVDVSRLHGTMSFLVMQLIDGIDLGRLCKSMQRLSSEDACEVIRQAALGVQHAHTSGLVHRDIKPSNLMLRRDGGIVLLDLGLARWMERGVPESLATTDGQILGTVDYLAPEQGVSHDVDHRADLYGLGATLYKLLSGHAPYDDSQNLPLLAKLKRIASEAPVPIDQRVEGLPMGLAALVHRCLARDPRDRPDSASELAKSLEPYCVGHQLGILGEQRAQTQIEPLVTDESNVLERTDKSWIPSGATVAWAFTTLVLIIALIWQSDWLTRSAPQRTETDSRTSNESSVAQQTDLDTPGTNGADQVPVLKQPSIRLSGHEECVFGLEFLDDDHLVSASWDGTVRFWDLNEGKEQDVFRVSELLTSLAVSPDGRWVIAGGGIRNTYVWDLENGQLVHRIQHGNVSEAECGVLRLDISRDSTRMMILTRGGGLWIHDLLSGRILCSHVSPDAESAPADACFVPDHRVAVIYRNQKMSIHDGENLEVLRKWDYTWSDRHVDLHTFEDREDSHNLVFTMNSSVFVSNEDARRAPTAYYVEDERLTDSAVLAGNQTVATATDLRNIYLWDVKSAQSRLRIAADGQCTQRIATSPSGRRIAGGGGWHVEHKLIHDGDYDLRVWDLPTF